MKRTNFYNIVTVEEINELDFLWNSLSDFTTEYTVDYYRIVAQDAMRPDLISYRCYGTVEFWWLILVFNGIENPFTDLVEGNILQIPNKLDIYNFQRKFMIR
jgi:hypothetical protein